MGAGFNVAYLTAVVKKIQTLTKPMVIYLTLDLLHQIPPRPLPKEREPPGITNTGVPALPRGPACL